MTTFSVSIAESSLDIEQARDIRRSALCGELNWPREIVSDPADLDATLAIAMLGAKPVASARLIRRDGVDHIELLAVLERFRKMGIGRSLLEVLEKKSGQAVHVLAPGPESAFFEHCGYRRQAEGGAAAVFLVKKPPN